MLGTGAVINERVCTGCVLLLLQPVRAQRDLTTGLYFHDYEELVTRSRMFEDWLQLAASSRMTVCDSVTLRQESGTIAKQYCIDSPDNHLVKALSSRLECLVDNVSVDTTGDGSETIEFQQGNSIHQSQRRTAVETWRSAPAKRSDLEGSSPSTGIL